jgi:CheY-like chemotaxis protein
MLVTSSATLRPLLGEMLAGLGATVDSVADGTEARAHAASSSSDYDYLIVDRQVGTEDGTSLVRSLRAIPSFAGSRMVLLTSVVDGDPASLRQEDGLLRLNKPVLEQELRAALLDGPVTEEPAPAPVPAQTPSSHQRILVVDDMAPNAEVAALMLRSLGYESDIAENGVAGLAALARRPYQAVLMDCQMPEMDGYEATQELRRREQGKRATPVIALTAHAMAGERERCLAAGMDDFLTKPFSKEQLKATLERWIGETTLPAHRRSSVS